VRAQHPPALLMMRAALDHDRKQERVLAAAAAVFADRGFHRASVRDVVAEAGMSLAGLYHYFPSKAGLLHEITMRAFDSLLARHDAAPPGPSRQRLTTFVRNHLAFFLSRPHEMKVLVRETESLPEGLAAEVEEKKRRYYQRCHDILRELDGGKSGEEELRLATLALFGMLNWTHSWYRPERDGSPDRLSERMLALFLHGFLGSPAGLAAPARAVPAPVSCDDDDGL
jgi:AcrR family transcriptional regulator